MFASITYYKKVISLRSVEQANMETKNTMRVIGKYLRELSVVVAMQTGYRRRCEETFEMLKETISMVEKAF